MEKIKGWVKSKKYDGSSKDKYTIYQSVKYPLKTYVSVGLIGNTNKGYWSITDEGTTAQFEYLNFMIAKKEAIKYMKEHPNG